MSNEKLDDWKPIIVSLPGRYWVTMLALTDQFVQKTAKPKLEELQRRGAGPDDIPDATKAALMGPLIARGAIVDALVEAGIMTPEAKATMGTDKLMEMAKRYYDKRRSSNGHK